MSSHLPPLLNVAIKAARAAGTLINRAALDIESMRIPLPQSHDFVTEVQQACQTSIVEIVSSAYPDHPIITPSSENAVTPQEYQWFISPLDGQANFVHGFPFYAVSIALSVRNRIEYAVIYDPVHNNLFFSSKGNGAFMNERRLRVSKRTALDQCLVSADFASSPAFSSRLITAQSLGCQHLRQTGCAALDLAYVAAGFCDAFLKPSVSICSAAAGALLVTEAGGLVGDFTGEADFSSKKELLAANPRIYGQLVHGFKSPDTLSA